MKFITHLHNTPLTYIICIFYFSHYYFNCYFEVTPVIVETFIIVTEISQVVPFKPIQYFSILHNDKTMHAHIINLYSYCRHYFYVCAWQVIHLIILLIWLVIVGGLFQLQMRILSPFLHAKHLRTSLFIMRTRSFFTLLYVGGT